MYRTRILPREEWPRLANTELERVWPVLDPEGARILVVEHDTTIVGCWALIPYLHAEGVWVHPDHRGHVSVARHLVTATLATARDMGASSLMTTALTPEVSALLTKHLGAIRLPGEMYAFATGE